MKQHTTKFLKTIALLYMAFPPVYMTSVALLFDIPATEVLGLLALPSFYFVSVLACLSGYGLWEMRRWGWYVFVPVNFMIALLSVFLLVHYSQSHHKGLALIAWFCVLYFVVNRTKQEVRVPYFLPAIAWWESNPRYRISVPVVITRGGGERFDGEILDLSLGGCFIKVRGEVQEEEAIEVRFTVFGRDVICRGLAVWKTHGAVTHPKGIGVKFQPHDRAQKRVMKVVTHRLAKLSTLYRRSRYLMSQEDFAKTLAKLQAPLSKGE